MRRSKREEAEGGGRGREAGLKKNAQKTRAKVGNHSEAWWSRHVTSHFYWSCFVFETSASQLSRAILSISFHFFVGQNDRKIHEKYENTWNNIRRAAHSTWCILMLYWGLLLPIESFFSWKKPLILATLTEKSSIQCLRCSLMTTCVTRSKSQRNYFWWSLVCNQGHVLRGFRKFEVLSVFVGCFLLLLFIFIVVLGHPRPQCSIAHGRFGFTTRPRQSLRSDRCRWRLVPICFLLGWKDKHCYWWPDCCMIQRKALCLDTPCEQLLKPHLNHLNHLNSFECSFNTYAQSQCQWQFWLRMPSLFGFHWWKAGLFTGRR